MIVDNQSKNFEDKITKTINLISSLVGLPTDVKIFKKFLVCPESLDVSKGHQNLKFPDDVRTETLTIEETYLNKPADDKTLSESSASICVRKR